jgi:hypothetical protein
VITVIASPLAPGENGGRAITSRDRTRRTKWVLRLLVSALAVIVVAAAIAIILLTIR